MKNKAKKAKTIQIKNHKGYEIFIFGERVKWELCEKITKIQIQKPTIKKKI